VGISGGRSAHLAYHVHKGCRKIPTISSSLYIYIHQSIYLSSYYIYLIFSVSQYDAVIYYREIDNILILYCSFIIRFILKGHSHLFNLMLNLYQRVHKPKPHKLLHTNQVNNDRIVIKSKHIFTCTTYKYHKHWNGWMIIAWKVAAKWP